MSKEAVQVPSYRNRVAYHATLLGGMAFIFSALVVLGNISTHDDIALRLKEDMLASLQQVLPAAIYDNQPLDDTLTLDDDSDSGRLTVYRARLAGKVVGVAFEVVGLGYAGPINIIMGIDNQGKLLGVRVISHLETPGLGDKIELVKSDWIKSFDGLYIGKPAKDKWKVKKDGGEFDQFTGATITPRAVVNAVKHGLEVFEHHRREILDDSDGLIKTSWTQDLAFLRGTVS